MVVTHFNKLVTRGEGSGTCSEKMENWKMDNFGAKMTHPHFRHVFTTTLILAIFFFYLPIGDIEKIFFSKNGGKIRHISGNFGKSTIIGKKVTLILDAKLGQL